MATIRYILVNRAGLVTRAATAKLAATNLHDAAWELCAEQAPTGCTVHVWADHLTAVPGVGRWYAGWPVPDASATALGRTVDAGLGRVWTRVA